MAMDQQQPQMQRQRDLGLFLFLFGAGKLGADLLDGLVSLCIFNNICYFSFCMHLLMICILFETRLIMELLYGYYIVA